jgi:hypothetical protein
MAPNRRPDADTVRSKRRLIALRYDRDPERDMRGNHDLAGRAGQGPHATP